MTEREDQVLLEIFRNEIRWYHFVTPEARNIVTDRVRTDVVRRLAEAGRVDIGTAEPGHYSVPSLVAAAAGSDSASPEPEPRASIEVEAGGEWHHVGTEAAADAIRAHVRAELAAESTKDGPE